MVVGGRGGEGGRGSGVCIPGEGRQKVSERERERGGVKRGSVPTTPPQICEQSMIQNLIS